ncbi:unnamed protein product [Closterium sp. NIES-53]
MLLSSVSSRRACRRHLLRPARRLCCPARCPYSPAHRPLRPALCPCSPRANPAAPYAAPCGPLAATCSPLATPCCCLPCSLRCTAPASRACCAAMASLLVLMFDHEGHPIQFDTWLDDLQLYLLSNTRDSVLFFDHTFGASPTPPTTADSATRSQWLTRDAAACLAIRNHLTLAECAHFGQHKTAQALYDAVVARYSSPATAALGRLLLLYLFPELSAFATIEDLVTHLHTSDARYRTALLAEFLDRNPPPMYITLYFIVTRLPDSLPTVRDDASSTSITVIAKPQQAQYQGEKTHQHLEQQPLYLGQVAHTGNSHPQH